MKQLKPIALAALLMTTAGCMQYLVQPPRPSIAGDPRTVETKSWLESHVQQPPYVLATACRNGEQLARVIVRRNAWQGFVAWVTLGLVGPGTVVYECANLSAPNPGSSGDTPTTTNGAGPD